MFTDTVATQACVSHLIRSQHVLRCQVSDASERQIAHLRAQAATTSGQHVEALRKAQDICAQAESRADAADRSGSKACPDTSATVVCHTYAVIGVSLSCRSVCILAATKPWLPEANALVLERISKVMVIM